MEEKKERALMSNREFKEYLETNKTNIVEDFFNKNILHLADYSGVTKFKSIRRAIRRGLASPSGAVYPKRPFNNRANTSNVKGHHSRAMNEEKKLIYGIYYAKGRVQ